MFLPFKPFSSWYFVTAALANECIYFKIFYCLIEYLEQVDLWKINILISKESITFKTSVTSKLLGFKIWCVRTSIDKIWDPYCCHNEKFLEQDNLVMGVTSIPRFQDVSHWVAPKLQQNKCIFWFKKLMGKKFKGKKTFLYLSNLSSHLIYSATFGLYSCWCHLLLNLDKNCYLEELNKFSHVFNKLVVLTPKS